MQNPFQELDSINEKIETFTGNPMGDVSVLMAFFACIDEYMNMPDEVNKKVALTVCAQNIAICWAMVETPAYAHVIADVGRDVLFRHDLDKAVTDECWDIIMVTAHDIYLNRDISHQNTMNIDRLCELLIPEGDD